MPYCPNCGHYISLGDTACSECGCSLAEGMESERSPEPRQQSEQRERNRNKQEGRTRRLALASAGGILGLMIFGTWGLGQFDERGPKDALEEWWTAWMNGDADAYRTLWHSESPIPARDGEEFPELAAPAERMEYIGETRETVERTDTEALVRDVFVLTDAAFENPRQITALIDLRTEDGNWRIWDYRREETEQLDTCRQTVSITGLSTVECE